MINFFQPILILFDRLIDIDQAEHVPGGGHPGGVHPPPLDAHPHHLLPEMGQERGVQDPDQFRVDPDSERIRIRNNRRRHSSSSWHPLSFTVLSCRFYITTTQWPLSRGCRRSRHAAPMRAWGAMPRGRTFGHGSTCGAIKNLALIASY